MKTLKKLPKSEIAKLSSIQKSWEETNKLLEQNVKILLQSCIRFNNEIEKYSIFM